MTPSLTSSQRYSGGRPFSECLLDLSEVVCAEKDVNLAQVVPVQGHLDLL
jgi:hypothetical protein